MTLFGRVFCAGVTDSSPTSGIKPFLPLLLYVLAALLTAAIYSISFRHVEKLIEDDKLHDLGAIADTKVEQIVAWHESEKRREKSFMRDSLVAVEFEQWLKEGAPANARKQRLQQNLLGRQYVDSFNAIALLDKEGRARIEVGSPHKIVEEDKGLARAAMESREVVFADFHQGGQDGSSINIDVAVPLIVAGKPDRIVGAAVMQIDPELFLYPLLSSWPTQSASAETLLVRREGNDVLFLNDVRHRPETALNLRLPLDTPNLPAAMAMRGERRVTDGIDYRGVPVVAEMRPVPGTPWFMVSKVDRAELFAPIYRLKQWATGLAFGFVAIGGALLFLWLRNYRSRYQLLRSQHDAAVERELLTRHYEYLTKYANDIILVADGTGNIIEANARALQVYGYDQAEFLSMQIRSLCDCMISPSVCEQQSGQFGKLDESRFETMHRRKDGSSFPVEVSARAIEFEGVRYLQYIVRDISERKLAEEALRKSEAVLKKSQQMAHIGSWEQDLKSDALYWSEENCRIFEFDPGSFGTTYQTFLDSVHPDDRERVNRAYTGSVQNKKPYSIIHRLLFPDGRIKFVQEWCETYYDESGQPLRSVGTTQDITEQQMFHQALRKSAQQIEDLYNLAPCGYHSLDADGIVVQMNDTELQWLGYTREEMIGRINYSDLFAPAYRHVFHENYPAFKQTGAAHDLEFELVRKDGTTFFVLLNGTAVYGDDGEFLMSRTTVFDITARKQAETRLEESEARFRSMADSAPIMIWMADAQEQASCDGCNYYNQTWYAFTGLPAERVHSCAWQRVIHGDDRARVVEAYREAFRQAQPFGLEYRLRRHDGEFRWVRDSGVPRLSAGGGFLGFIGTTVDVTDHKLFDEMRAEMEHAGRLQIAGEMVSGLAHELSQPLTAANNYLSAGLRQMAQTGWDGEKLRKTVSLAHAQTERAGKIINHLKDMVRKQRQERAMLDINALVRDTVHFMEYEIRQTSVSVIMDFYTLPPVRADRVEIEQVLINLFKNAIDAMADAPTRVLRITTRPLESGFVLVSVSDTGKGLVPDALERIFDPFHSSKSGGLGLGLPICRSLIENHGGKIWAERNGDEGAEFNFTLPAGASDEQEQRA